ncbi:HNH endonuclease [Caulobacter sp. 17J80-11]|uniref:HNH endonuclease n=1 Tax=Caulobacter sp. 17J80-11 TaxID=2763502 RepID=UPI001653436F|nr:HNH endonuclease signature motif containing protein [Caulobacter sp. 17J80-11]MBC6982876.1 HNH endonuclease [Caulobacter sp. 17J80-11]
MRHNVDIAELVRLYTVEGLTSRQIGQRLNVPYRTLLRYLHNAGVTLRGTGEPHNPLLDDVEWLKARYITERKSTPEIAALIGCSPRIVCTWLERHGIERRSRGSEKGHTRATDDARQKMSTAKKDRFLGADNPNWKGGQPTVDPDRNRYRAKAWVRAVKSRDGWRCVKCGSQTHLHAHHIKRWKEHPELRYDLNNGVTLCFDCHEEAHGRGFKFRFPRSKATAAQR